MRPLGASTSARNTSGLDSSSGVTYTNANKHLTRARARLRAHAAAPGAQTGEPSAPPPRARGGRWRSAAAARTAATTPAGCAAAWSSPCARTATGAARQRVAEQPASEETAAKGLKRFRRFQISTGQQGSARQANETANKPADGAGVLLTNAAKRLPAGRARSAEGRFGCPPMGRR